MLWLCHVPPLAASVIRVPSHRHQRTYMIGSARSNSKQHPWSDLIIMGSHTQAGCPLATRETLQEAFHLIAS